MTEREEALSEAKSLITGDREREYGNPRENFSRIAERLNVSFPDANFTPYDVAIMMIDVKMGRISEGYKRDTLIDIIGYAAIAVELAETAGEGPDYDLLFDL